MFPPYNLVEKTLADDCVPSPGPVEVLKVCLLEIDLPGSDGLRKIWLNFDQETHLNAVFMWDESIFGAVNGRKGVKLILTPHEAEILRSKQRRYQVPADPRAPTIQKLLIQAHNLKSRLDETPLLKRGALAKEIGMNPSYLTRVMHLLNLSPEIQDHILQLKPSVSPGPITENRIRFLARNPDHKFQISEFKRLIDKQPRARYKLNHLQVA